MEIQIRYSVPSMQRMHIQLYLPVIATISNDDEQEQMNIAFKNL